MFKQIWLKVDLKTRKQSLSGLGAELRCSAYLAFWRPYIQSPVLKTQIKFIDVRSSNLSVSTTREKKRHTSALLDEKFMGVQHFVHYFPRQSNISSRANLTKGRSKGWWKQPFVGNYLYNCVGLLPLVLPV